MDPLRPGRHTVGGEIDRFVQAVRSHHAQLTEFMEVVEDRSRPQGKGQHGRIGCDDEVVGQSSLETQARHTERSVLVVRVGIEGVVPRLRDAPGNTARAGVLDLAVDRRERTLMQESALAAAHDQVRHEVLEHRGTPRQQGDATSPASGRPAQGVPVFLRHIPP